MKKEKETKNLAVKGEKPGFFKKIGMFFSKIGKYFKEVIAEVSKLSWPTKKEIVNYTLAVIGFVALMALIMWVLDLGFSEGVKALASIGK